jgi:hypothetical protein
MNMSERSMEVIKVCFCEHIKQEVALEADVLYPADFLPDPPRVLSHRCSRGEECNLFDQAACVWAGTNPVVDPFRT